MQAVCFSIPKKKAVCNKDFSQKIFFVAWENKAQLGLPLVLRSLFKNSIWIRNKNLRMIYFPYELGDHFIV